MCCTVGCGGLCYVLDSSYWTKQTSEYIFKYDYVPRLIYSCSPYGVLMLGCVSRVMTITL